MNWRPEGWDNPYHDIFDGTVFYPLCEIFEEGADAMLNALGNYCFVSFANRLLILESPLLEAKE